MDKPKSKRKGGAQPGHPQHKRPLFCEAQLDRIVDHHALEAGRGCCPDCGGELELLDAPAHIWQQVELDRNRHLRPTWCERLRVSDPVDRGTLR